jgi:hypothetical protein
LPIQFAPPRPLPLPATNGAAPPAADGDERQQVGLRPPMAPPGGP